MKWQSTPQTTAWVICILHKLWGRYLFFAESGSFSPFWLKFPLIFQNDQVPGNTLRVVCFIFKDGGVYVWLKSQLQTWSSFLTSVHEARISMRFHGWHFEEHHAYNSLPKTRGWLKEGSKSTACFLVSTEQNSSSSLQSTAIQNWVALW